MDPVTHGIVGATSAQLFSDEKSFRAASFVGCIAALAPDLDVFLYSDSDPLLQLELHRHFTHSLLFIPIGSLMVAGILWWVVRKKLTFKQTYFFSLAGYATAGFMDVITSYGVHLLWPLLDDRYSLNIISVFDPLFTVILLGISVFALVKKRKSLTLAAVAWVIFYLSIGFVQKSRVTELAYSKIDADQEIIVKPTLGNQLLWSARYIEDNQLCGIGIRVGFFSEPKIYDGACAPLVDWQQEYSNIAGTVLYDDIRRFSELSDGLLVRHPHYPNVLGDGRYSMLPTTLSPLWGIKVDTTNTNQHVNFDSYRDASEEVRSAYLDMVLDRNAAIKDRSTFCQDFIPVNFNELTICVAPDYFSVDGIRTPLGYSDALHLADSLGMWLPSVEMVNAIYQQAEIKLAPIPMPPTDEMTTKAYYVRHHYLIEAQLADSGFFDISGKLIAGHKKDVIAIDRDSDKVGIYGWHLSDSTVIQPFSIVHRRDYFDYSHGIRLIKRTALDQNGNSVELQSPY